MKPGFNSVARQLVRALHYQCEGFAEVDIRRSSALELLRDGDLVLQHAKGVVFCRQPR